MLTPPTDLDSTALVHALAHWDLSDARLEYTPVGFGSHHWTADGSEGLRAFVTVDDLAAGFQAGGGVEAAFAALERAYRTAAALRDLGGLDFVLAPLEDDEGALLRRLDERYAVSVAPFVDGTSSSFGAYESKDERRRIGELLGRLHVAGEIVPAGLPRRDDFSVPSRSALTEALATLGVAWETGPFAEPARILLAAAAEELEERLRSYDVLAARVRGRSQTWVITHGEPHRGNVIAAAAGGLRLVDWDTTRLAPRERDLWMVLDDELTGWDEYARLAGEVSLDREALELYRQWWDLADIALFVAVLRQPHEDDEQTAATYENLRGYLGG
jgi:spectinomycin phosphotransferase